MSSANECYRRGFLRRRIVTKFTRATLLQITQRESGCDEDAVEGGFKKFTIIILRPNSKSQLVPQGVMNGAFSNIFLDFCLFKKINNNSAVFRGITEFNIFFNV